MNRTKIEWVKNPDGTQGCTWNPITGCLNGCEYCYARKLANGRLRTRYLANPRIAIPNGGLAKADLVQGLMKDPFYPRFWGDDSRLYDPFFRKPPSGIFVCDMGELFGDWLPEGWISDVFDVIKHSPWHRFYLLTKQPQNLIKFSPFPGNCWVGVTATGYEAFNKALDYLKDIEAKVKFISIEPLLEAIPFYMERLAYCGINQLIIGAQTKPYKPPKIAWVEHIVEAADKAGVPVFLKDNLGWPKLSADGALPFYKRCPSGTMELRQEMPEGR